MNGRAERAFFPAAPCRQGKRFDRAAARKGSGAGVVDSRRAVARMVIAEAVVRMEMPDPSPEFCSMPSTMTRHRFAGAMALMALILTLTVVAGLKSSAVQGAVDGDSADYLS